MKLTQGLLQSLIKEVLNEAPKKKAKKKVTKKPTKKAAGKKSPPQRRLAPVGDKTFGQAAQSIMLRRVANQVREHAFKHMISSMTKWQDDLEMIQMFCSDYGDSLEVVSALETGDLKGAKELAWGMDTAARDNLAPEFWDLNNHADTDGFNSFD